MRAVVQRVKEAGVSVKGTLLGRMGKGVVVLLGIGQDDKEEDADYLLSKIINLRIFEDAQGKMNLSLKDVNGEMMVISQFTLYGDCRKGRRPSFIMAAEPSLAKKLYDYFINQGEKAGIKTVAGKFQAMMDVNLINEGPVTLILDSRKVS
ncbi:MAG TPA: D-aminoacyl-tRNA deacylase [Nitrospinota bacterium]|nr:D-aminoacyl-tRNA deacylase [Nitrospinota bacterium]